MNEKKRTRTSKFLSLVLRHEPEAIGLALDPAGWVDVAALLSALRQHGREVTRAELEEVVATNEKQRFAFSEDGRRLRANQGHSVEVELGYAPQIPPAQLFHGTATRFLGSIRAEGLRKGQRQHVHLSAELNTATAVGQRHGRPAVLIVQAVAMHAAGYAFFLSQNGVWLTDHVPVEFIEFTDVNAAPVPSLGKRSSRAHQATETVAICDHGRYLAAGGREVVIDQILREAVTRTTLHSAEEALVASPSVERVTTALAVTSETTLAALHRLAGEAGGHLAALNFASAKNPGGGFLGGAEAQEESLARSSGLYPCLLAAREYYERQRACRTTLYLDLAIWSPGVPFFRDDSGALLPAPTLASIITAPAPNAGAIASNEPERLPELEPTLRRRAAFVLALARAQGVRRFVLGAWGCGVFRNDPRLVAQVFANLLGPSGAFDGAFDEVTFAIYDRSREQEIVRLFSDALHGAAVARS